VWSWNYATAAMFTAADSAVACCAELSCGISGVAMGYHRPIM